MDNPVAWMYIHKKFKMNDVLLNQREFDSDVIEEIPLYTHPVKQLSDEDLKLLKKVINDCAGNIEYRIDIERLAFKGYEHCSELESLYEEQKDANRAIAIIKEITE